MKTSRVSLAYAYLRLSREEAQGGESSSITNQRRIIEDYCKNHGYTLLQVFVDDGWSGGNFDRPGFQSMMQELEKGKASLVITKDLSRLGRDMRESSYYAEQFFPEHCIRYIAIADNFDTEHENIMAPFQFAMNEVYLRDGSRKVRDVLKSKRESGLYCACPPYGYRKDEHDRNRLVPDERTAPVVQRIFRAAGRGDSSHKISTDLNRDQVIPPLKYRVLYRDEFSAEGAARASEQWNHTTVKRILKNQVYLGHTVLGKTKKVSVKSKKKMKLSPDNWAITYDTHTPLVTDQQFHEAQENLARNSTSYRDCTNPRISIFRGIAFCGRCGHALCSGGGVYKGEREKYWMLYCTQQRKDAKKPCEGVHIKYADLMELVRQDLNSLISLSDEEVEQMVANVLKQISSDQKRNQKKQQTEQTRARLITIDRMITKLYTDNAEGRISDERLDRMMQDLEREAKELEILLAELTKPDEASETAEKYAHFFELARQYTHIETLTQDILRIFVERIEVGPKVMEDGQTHPARKKSNFTQSVRIFYKFIGALDGECEEADREDESNAAEEQ
jgi:DNA invertase Pin-like site-specific DNA recombinase